ncbi:TIR domain-containing protein [Mesorhizobium amorphae]|uniref:TIR domain-containing protein n=1 Tax=Mesorhizobium amorphae TaxID=71433 RepID=UPI003ED00D4D
MFKTRAFISFDYDHDEVLKTFLVGQAKLPDSPFDLADWSIKEHIDGNWKAKAAARIRAVDVVIVICGKHTHTATGVSAEVMIAQDEAKPYFLLNGYKDVVCSKPTGAKATDQIYNWTWDNLKILISGGR